MPIRWSPHLQDLFYIKNPHYLTTHIAMTSCMNCSLECYNMKSVITILFSAKIVPKQNKLTKWKRCYKQFHPENFTMHPSTNVEVNFTSNPENPNEEFNNFLKIFKYSVDHNASLIKISRKWTKLAWKPWITKGLLNSIKTKTKL